MKELLAKTEEKMNKTIAVLERDYKSIRAGRANVSVLDRITVDYYGSPTPIQQMAAVSVPETRILMIQPWDATTLKPIEKAILTSDIGINPQNDGSVIRLNFPPLTEERRRDLAKEVKKMADDIKKVGIQFTAEGAVDFQKSLQSVSQASKSAYTDLKLAQSQYDSNTSAVQKLTDSQKEQIAHVTAEGILGV